MIPTDIAARLRVLLESAIQPVHPVKEVPADLPDFVQGQRFSARITEVLPDNTFRAIVAGKTLTLALPHSAKAGDALELIVLDRTPKVVTARFAAPPPGHEEQAAPNLSRTARLIGSLLASPSARPSAPATVAAAGPLLPQAPTRAEPIATALRQAIADSGLFYESHLAQWLAGRMPVSQLMREPQGQYARPTVAPGAPAVTSASTDRSPPEATNADAAAQTPATPRTSGGATMPADLLPVVQQQLQALGSHAIVWSGQIWPDQEMQWEIERPPDRQPDAAEKEARPWRSHLRLSLPRLGDVSANLTISPGGIDIALSALDPDTTSELSRAAAGLRNRFDAAGLPLTGLRVERNESA